MDKEIDAYNAKPEDVKDFIEKIAGIHSSKLIFDHGYNYIDNIKFWQWMKETYAKSGRFSNPNILKDVFSTLHQEKGITARSARMRMKRLLSSLLTATTARGILKTG